MKKFIASFFVLAFVFGLFIFNTNIAKADSEPGCNPGYLFSPVTGHACTSIAPTADCKVGDLFSSITGLACGALSGSNSTSSNSSDNASIIAKFNTLFQNGYKLGTQGNAAKNLQQFLKDQGYYFGKLDGKYGKISARAVKDFQDDYGLNASTVSPTPCPDGTVPIGMTQSIPGSYICSIPAVSTLSITTPSLLVAQVGVNYKNYLTATGGNGKYLWTVTAGSLPVNFGDNDCHGVNCQPAVMSGTPTDAGTFSFTVKVTSGSQSISKDFTMRVDPPNFVFRITTPDTLPNAKAGTSYSTNLDASVVTSSGLTISSGIDWSVVSGSLPTGLFISTTSEPKVISGTPTVAGTYKFSLTAVFNSTTTIYQSTIKTFTLTVDPASVVVPPVSTPSIKVTPQTSNSGDALTISWSGIQTPTNQDWFGIYNLKDNIAHGIENTGGIWAPYLNCFPNSAPISPINPGTCMGPQLQPGEYEVRLYTGTQRYYELATSPTFTVLKSGCTSTSGFSLTTSQSCSF